MILIILMATSTICFSWPDCQTVLTAADARLESVKIYQKIFRVSESAFSNWTNIFDKKIREFFCRTTLSFDGCKHHWFGLGCLWFAIGRFSKVWRCGWHTNWFGLGCQGPQTLDVVVDTPMTKPQKFGTPHNFPISVTRLGDLLSFRQLTLHKVCKSWDIRFSVVWAQIILAYFVQSAFAMGYFIK